MTKNQCENEIIRAIEHAKESGFNVYVASDEEGNGWNELNPLYMKYGDTNKNSIALGVFKQVDEDDIFQF